MKATNDQPTTAHPRRHTWIRYTTMAILVLVLIGAAVFLINGQSLPQVTALEQPTTAAAVAAQPQGTPPAGMPVPSQGTPPANLPAPPAGAASTSDESAPTANVETAPATTATPPPASIVAIAGSTGAKVYALEGNEVVQTVPVGGKLLLSGRTADSAWLVVELDGERGWVTRTAVIAFNLNRLSVVTATPPADVDVIPMTVARVATAAVATTVVTMTDTMAETTTITETTRGEEVVEAAASAAQPTGAVTATLDTDKARGLNIRSGPGADYARVGAIAAEATLVVTGRNVAGDWLAVELPDATTGWAAAHYLIVTGDVAALPEIQLSAAVQVETATTPATPSVTTESSTPAASVTAASVPRTQSTGLEGTLAFQTGQGGVIYAYDLATGDLWPLTTGFDPAVSPDGTTVAFARVGNDAGLYLIDIDGSNERQIYSGPRVIASPKWSADGAQLLFNYATSEMQCRDLGGGRCVTDDKFETGRYSDLDINDYVSITLYTYDLGVVAVDGSAFRSLSALNTGRAPDWAAAGIVYQSSDGVQMMSTQGGDSHVILFDPLTQVDQDPDWVGGRVVFQRPGASHWEIWTADANGANIAALTQPQTVLVDQLPSNVAPAYSPDGSQIVFLSNRTESGEAGAWRIWVMNADGSNQRALPIDVAINYTFGAEQMVSWGG